MIDALFKRHKEIAAYLRERGEVSFATEVESYLSKTLLLSSASYFETRVSDAIVAFAARVSQSDAALVSLVRRQVIERKYHTYFQWGQNGSGAISFFSMFGQTMKETAKLDLKREELTRSAKAFLELGQLRNQLVHENFANYRLEKTPDEVLELYQSSLSFVQYIENRLNPASPQAMPAEAE